jgi:ribosomal protein S18 acetylase RimI-like enzyme
VRIEAIDPSSFDDAIDGLAALLVDAVDGGASVNFLAGVTRAEAAAWWAARTEAVRSGTITVFVAREGDGDGGDGDGDRIVGSTLLERSRNQNSPHRAEIGKVIVHRSARRRGIATALMRAAEEQARAEGRWMLVLDTVTDSPAAALYESLGWQTVGTIPGYALNTAGQPEAATYYYKDLR